MAAASDLGRTRANEYTVAAAYILNSPPAPLSIYLSLPLTCFGGRPDDGRCQRAPNGLARVRAPL